MDNEDIKTSIKILGHQGHSNLGKLLDGAQGEIDQANPFGSRRHFLISTLLRAIRKELSETMIEIVVTPETFIDDIYSA